MPTRVPLGLAGADGTLIFENLPPLGVCVGGCRMGSPLTREVETVWLDSQRPEVVVPVQVQLLGSWGAKWEEQAH